METMPDYDPTHKAASISSMTSTSSTETVPSLYSGADASESVYDTGSPSFRPLNLQYDLGLDPSTMMEGFFYPDANQVCHEEFKGMSQGPIYLKERDAQFTIPLSRKRKASPSQEENARDGDANKQARDLLTEEERRVNHIASEQKRRNTIRNGFKDLTDIIPTLKNINNSKSTILFKAYEYIRHLEKRNRGLREKRNALQMRLEVQGRMTGVNALRHMSPYGRQQTRRPLFQPDSYPLCRGEVTKNHIPPEALAALAEHKNQQDQLAMLREQLRIQQALLTKHNIIPPSTTALPEFSIPSQTRYPYFDAPATSYPHANAIVMPMHDDGNWRRPTNMLGFNIPADEEFGAETVRQERLLTLDTTR